MAIKETVGEEDEELGLDVLDKKLMDELKKQGFDDDDLIAQFAEVAQELADQKTKNKK